LIQRRSRETSFLKVNAWRTKAQTSEQPEEEDFNKSGYCISAREHAMTSAKPLGMLPLLILYRALETKCNTLFMHDNSAQFLCGFHLVPKITEK
jgi:hypothetical protein